METGKDREGFFTKYEALRKSFICIDSAYRSGHELIDAVEAEMDKGIGKIGKDAQTKEEVEKSADDCRSGIITGSCSIKSAVGNSYLDAKVLLSDIKEEKSRLDSKLKDIKRYGTGHNPEIELMEAMSTEYGKMSKGLEGIEGALAAQLGIEKSWLPELPPVTKRRVYDS